MKKNEVRMSAIQFYLFSYGLFAAAYAKGYAAGLKEKKKR